MSLTSDMFVALQFIVLNKAFLFPGASSVLSVACTIGRGIEV